MKIKIKSTDIHGQYYEKDFELKNKSDYGNKKEYHYEDEYGKCKIFKFNDTIEIYRYGQINSKQIFKTGEKTSFTYFTKIIVTEDEKIYLEYDIINGNEILNKIKLEVTELI